MSDPDPVRLGFVCVRNAGRSQMSAAFAEREREARGLGGGVEIVTGGTRPADAVHDVVVEVMREEGFDLADRRPRAITTGELESCDVVVTMGCSTLDLGAESAGGDVRDWALDDPGGRDLGDVRGIRDEIAARVSALFDELERKAEAEGEGKKGTQAGGDERPVADAPARDAAGRAPEETGRAGTDE